MKKEYLLIILLLIIISVVKAQNSEIDSLEKVLSNYKKQDTIKIQLLNKVAHLVYRTNIKKTLLYATQADSLSGIINYKKGKAESIRLIGLYHDEKGNYPQALHYYQKSLKINEEIKYKEGQVRCYINIGLIYRMQGNFPKALENFKEALNLSEEIAYKRGSIYCYINIGNLYIDQGDYHRALEYYQKSLKINEELEDKEGISYTYANIGIIYFFQDDYPRALEYYLKSLEIDEELGDKLGMSVLYNNISELYTNQGDYKQALYYNQESLTIKEELGDKNGMCHSYKNFGNIYAKMESYSKAIDYYKKGLELSEEMGLKGIITSCNYGLSKVNYELNKYSLSKNYGEKAYKTAKEIGEKEKIKEASEILAKTYASLGDYKKAYNYQIEFKAQSDSLINDENTKKILGLEYQYLYEKEKQAIMLEQSKKDEIHIREIEKQKTIRNFSIIVFTSLIFISLLLFNRYKLNQKRASLEFEKHHAEVENRLLRSQMNPHFIFNSLYSIQGFVASNDSQTAQSYIVDFASLMRAILNNSRESFIPLEKEIETIRLYMKLEQMRFAEKFSYRIEIDNNIEQEFILVPPMLIQPFVENSIIHGLFPKEGNGNLTIEMKEQNNSLLCSIIDDGIGREESYKQKEIKVKEHKSVGIEVTKNRLKLLGEELKMNTFINIIDLKDENNKALGTKVDILIPTKEA